MVILGVAFLSDASACVLKDGVLLSSISEERINRIKLWHGIPHQAISEALRLASVTIDDIDVIATHGESAGQPLVPAFEAKRKLIDQANLDEKTKKSQLASIDSRLKREREILGQRTPAYLEELERYNKPILKFSHHTAHAACAYFGSGWETCYVLTADGWGEDASSTLWATENGRLKKISNSNTFDSLGYFYGSVTRCLGFTPHRHEGKVLGLAAYSDNPPHAHPLIDNMIRYDSRSQCFIGLMENGIFKPQYENPELEDYVKHYSREDIAAATQQRLEEVVCQLVSDLSGSNNRLAVAGGVFANVKLNQRIADLDNIDEVYVFPNMGDGGLSVGAAWLAHEQQTGSKPRVMDSAFLGNNITDKDAQTALAKSGFTYKRVSDIETHVAELLAQGEVVVRVNGRMEFGPRALGNRSILYKASDASVNEWLNARLCRSEFMPFAPATLIEHAKDHYYGLDLGATSAEYMTMTFNCTDKMKRQSPAAVHVDGTARPQLVSSSRYPEFHRLLSKYYTLTDRSSVINTSFNMHEEPIVRTSDDAIRAFSSSSLPWLALGNFIVQGTD